MVLAVSFYRAIPKILRQLTSYNSILVAMNAKEMETIAKALQPQTSDTPSFARRLPLRYG